jgi:azurin
MHTYVCSILAVAFEATKPVLSGLFGLVEDPDIIACAMCSVDIISNKMMGDITSIPITVSKECEEQSRSEVQFGLIWSDSVVK